MSANRIIFTGLLVILLVVGVVPAGRAEAWSACGSTYVVQRGDWLARIARKCGITLTDLYSANPWAWSYRYIYPGQVLVIPGGYYDPGPYYCGPSYDYYGGYYVVCRGDTLGGIALYFGVSVAHLRWKNGIGNANLIYPGQVIRP